jgi:DNA-binding protein HU-alpha
MGIFSNIERLKVAFQLIAEPAGPKPAGSGSQASAQPPAPPASSPHLQPIAPTRTSPMMEAFSPQAIEYIRAGAGGPNTSSGIIRSMAELVGIDIESAAKVVDGFWAYVTDQGNYSGGQRKKCLIIPHFGSFSVTQIPARSGRNPRTGERMIIQADKRITFKLSPSMPLEKIHKTYWCDELHPNGGLDHPQIYVKKASAQWASRWNGKGVRHLSKKRQICVYIRELTGLPLDQVSIGLSVMLYLILARVITEPVVFRKRGVFKVIKRAARSCRSPRTGEMMRIEASQTIGFRAYRGLKQQL